MKKILIVYHSLSGNTECAAGIVAQGAKSAKNAEVIIKQALKTSESDLAGCDAIGIGTADYFSYMAGALKDLFDRTFYSTKEKMAGKPCAVFVTHGGGGRPAAESVEKICKSFNLKPVAAPVLCKGRPKDEDESRLKDLGKKLAEAVN